MKDDLVLINEVLEKIPNKYKAMAVASKRARELNMGSRPLVDTNASKPTTVALYEIAAGLVVPGPLSLEHEFITMHTDNRETLPTSELLIDDTEEETDEVIAETETIDEEDEGDDIEIDIDPPDELGDKDLEEDEEE